MVYKAGGILMPELGWLTSGGKSASKEMVMSTGGVMVPKSSNASGLTRVPYDNYPALLHQGERVLTAQETRQADRASGGIQVTITGNTFSVRSEQDAENLAKLIVEKIKQAALVQG